MGISSVNNPDAKIEVVPDCEQRAGAPLISAAKNYTPDLLPEYFQEPTTVAQQRAANNQKVCHNRLSSCHDRLPILEASSCAQRTMGETVSAKMEREGRSID